MTPWLLRPPFFLLRAAAATSRASCLRSVHLREVADRAAAPARGCRLVLYECPWILSFSRMRRSSDPATPLAAKRSRRTRSCRPRAASRSPSSSSASGPMRFLKRRVLPWRICVRPLDADVEQLLDRGLDLRLGGRDVHLEAVGVVPRALVRALFGDERAQDDLVRLELRARAGRRAAFRLAVQPPQSFRSAVASAWSSRLKSA